MNVTLFNEVSEADIHRLIDTQVMGNIWMCRAVWPHMEAAQYGRIVTITSDAMLGMRFNAVYAAAEGAIFSLTRGLV